MLRQLRRNYSCRTVQSCIRNMARWNAMRVVIVVAVLAWAVDVQAAKRRARRRATQESRVDHALPLSPTPEIRDAILLLEQARVTICEAESLIRQPIMSGVSEVAPAIPDNVPRHRLASYVVDNAHSYERNIDFDAVVFETLVTFASFLDDLGKAAFQIETNALESRDAIPDANRLIESRRAALSSAWGLSNQMSSLLRVIMDLHESKFEDLPSLRFWNSSGVTPDEIVSATAQMNEQADLVSEMAHMFRQRNALLELGFAVYSEHCDLVSHALTRPMVAATLRIRLQAANNTKAFEDLVNAAELNVFARERIADRSCKLKMANDRLDLALERVELVHLIVERIRFLMDLVASPSSFRGLPDPAPSSKKTKKKKPVTDTPVVCDAEASTSIDHCVDCAQPVVASTAPGDVDVDNLTIGHDRDAERDDISSWTKRKPSSDRSTGRTAEVPSRNTDSLPMPLPSPVATSSTSNSSTKDSSVMMPPPGPFRRIRKLSLDSQIAPHIKAMTLARSQDFQLTADLLGFVASSKKDRQSDSVYHRQGYRAVKQAVRLLFPGGTVRLTGSIASGLHLPAPASDLDIVVRHPTVHWSIGLLQLFVSIRGNPSLSSVKYIPTASTPIIKATIANASVNVDITWNVANVDESRHFIMSAMNQYPLFKPLTMYMKHYLYMYGLGNPYYGGLGSFPLYLLVIFHLQANSAACSQSAGACLRAFFGYYGFAFRIDYDCISVHTNGRPLSKIERVHRGPLDITRLCIENTDVLAAINVRISYSDGAHIEFPKTDTRMIGPKALPRTMQERLPCGATTPLCRTQYYRVTYCRPARLQPSTLTSLIVALARSVDWRIAQSDGAGPSSSFRMSGAAMCKRRDPHRAASNVHRKL
ncbi:unnamed protein product (mitochondrion) [Plasmodiophora brassicae]|uniref:Poly(A) RNA polymerase mitochondrial-like central palm domain-containing protein n=1 Tax=Plasmodiophora brassicae TaxID=37360 RepID=A0A3P3Y517_PLABS|nr:unnamed protein product [Plasmodiophora brassicae]